MQISGMARLASHYSAMSTSSSSSTSSSTSTSSSSSTTDYKTMFLQLLVAQLKNQDPLNPTDSQDMVTELAQFQLLEETISTNEELTGLHNDFNSVFGVSSTSSTSTSTSASTGSTTSK